MSWKRVISEGKFDGPFYNGDLFLDIKKNHHEMRQKAFQIFKYLHLTNLKRLKCGKMSITFSALWKQ